MRIVYSSYKYIGQKWVLEIPEHWEIKRLKAIFSMRTERNSPVVTDNILSLTAKQGVVPYSKKEGVGGNKPKDDLSKYNIARENDLIVNCMNVVSGAAGVSKYFGAISPVYYALYLRAEENVWYYHHIFRLTPFQRSLIGLGKGILMHESDSGKLNTVRMRISMDYLGNVLLPVPPRFEQDQIVRFLDWKVSRINKLISVKRKQIALLHERQSVHISHIVTRGLRNGVATKDSGAEWLGDIPEHWHTMRCKYLFSERDERSQDGSEQHLSMSQKYGLVPDSQLDERRMLSESYVGGKLCDKDDLVLNRLKAHLGVFALAPQSGVISPDYTVLRPNTARILPSFAETLLKSDRCRGELCIRVRGIIEGFWRLYTDDFNTIVLPVPPLDEQAEIMEYIVEFRDKAKKYEDTLTQEISSLQELKARLISDTVTGKIDVRGIQIPEYEFAEENIDTENDESMEGMECETYEE